MQGKEAIIKLLEQAGVNVVFGLCGDTSLPYYEAFYDLQPDIRHVLTRDERSAGYMADAYARLSGRVGVCEGPSGGGVTYILPGVAEANQSSVPLICLTSDIDSSHRWRGTLTELDQDALFQPLTVYTNTPDQGSDLPQTFREAFKSAVSGAMGASHIGVALNVQEAEIADDDITSRRVEDPQDLGDALKWAIGQNSPVLLDVVMQPLHEANAPVSKWIA